jgi:uncharacterized protein
LNHRAIYSTEPARGWLPWGVIAPLLMILFVAASTLGVSCVLEQFGLVDPLGDPIGLTGLLAFLVFPFSALGAVVLLWVRFVERRSMATIGLAGKRRAQGFLGGLVIGMATISLVVAGIWIAGGLQVRAVATAWSSGSTLVSMAMLLPGFALQSSVEEIVFRGWLQSVLARKFNVAVAVALTSAAFTFLHYSPHQDGLVVMSSFLFSTFACCWALHVNSIWGVMGWHAGWNWLLATGFELPVTGIDAKLPALLVGFSTQGSDALTGGAQGPEGSYLCSIFFVLAIAFIALRHRTRRPSSLSPAAAAG